MKRTDTRSQHRNAYDKNKKKILASQNICAICGGVVDFTLKYPHPLSPSVDHIIPISKGGHPSSLDNLQLTHLKCNISKSDKTVLNLKDTKRVLNQNILPLTFDYFNLK